MPSEKAHKADDVIPDWVWAMSGSLASQKISKFNPYHDAQGRFSTADGDVTGSGAPADYERGRLKIKDKNPYPRTTDEVLIEHGVVEEHHLNNIFGVEVESQGVVIEARVEGMSEYHGEIEVYGRLVTSRGTGAGTFQRNLNTDEGTVYNDHFVINEEFQGRGIGTAISAHWEDQLVRAGYHKMSTSAFTNSIYNGAYTWLKYGYTPVHENEVEIVINDFVRKARSGEGNISPSGEKSLVRILGVGGLLDDLPTHTAAQPGRHRAGRGTVGRTYTDVHGTDMVPLLEIPAFVDYLKTGWGGNVEWAGSKPLKLLQKDGVRKATMSPQTAALVEVANRWMRQNPVGLENDDPRFWEEVKQARNEISKFNPYHDQLGRFTTADANVTGTAKGTLTRAGRRLTTARKALERAQKATAMSVRLTTKGDRQQIKSFLDNHKVFTGNPNSLDGTELAKEIPAISDAIKVTENAVTITFDRPIDSKALRALGGYLDRGGSGSDLWRKLNPWNSDSLPSKKTVKVMEGLKKAREQVNEAARKFVDAGGVFVQDWSHPTRVPNVWLDSYKGEGRFHETPSPWGMEGQVTSRQRGGSEVEATMIQLKDMLHRAQRDIVEHSDYKVRRSAKAAAEVLREAVADAEAWEANPEDVSKFNPYHDELGRFSTADRATTVTATPQPNVEMPDWKTAHMESMGIDAEWLREKGVLVDNYCMGENGSYYDPDLQQVWDWAAENLIGEGALYGGVTTTIPNDLENADPVVIAEILDAYQRMVDVFPGLEMAHLGINLESSAKNGGGWAFPTPYTEDDRQYTKPARGDFESDIEYSQAVADYHQKGQYLPTVHISQIYADQSKPNAQSMATRRWLGGRVLSDHYTYTDFGITEGTVGLLDSIKMGETGEKTSWHPYRVDVPAAQSIMNHELGHVMRYTLARIAPKRLYELELKVLSVIDKQPTAEGYTSPPSTFVADLRRRMEDREPVSVAFYRGGSNQYDVKRDAEGYPYFKLTSTGLTGAGDMGDPKHKGGLYDQRAGVGEDSRYLPARDIYHNMRLMPFGANGMPRSPDRYVSGDGRTPSTTQQGRTDAAVRTYRVFRTASVYAATNGDELFSELMSEAYGSSNPRPAAQMLKDELEGLWPALQEMGALG